MGESFCTAKKRGGEDSIAYHLNVIPCDSNHTHIKISEGSKDFGGEVKGALGTRGTGIDNSSFGRLALVGDLDFLATLGIVVAVGAIGHVNIVDGYDHIVGGVCFATTTEIRSVPSASARMGPRRGRISSGFC